MLHGGGPGASGVSNYSRNIDALAAAIPSHRARYARLRPLGTKASTNTTRSVTWPKRSADCSTNSGSTGRLWSAIPTAVRPRCGWRWTHRAGWIKLVLMGPGGIGTTRAVPTAGLKSLMSYYRGGGPSRERLETFIRTYLVYDGASVPD